MQLNRRTVLGGAAAASAATALTPFAALQAQAQAAGFHKYKVGSIDVAVVTDGVNTFKFPDGFVVNKSRDEVNAAWVAMAQQADQMVVPYSPIAVKTHAASASSNSRRAPHASTPKRSARAMARKPATI